MTQIETIIAEIERLKEVFVPTVNVEYQDFSKFLLDFVIDSIKSLPAEQPSEDLEEAANIYANKQGLELKPFARRFFIAGAQWQKEQITKLLKTIYSDCDNLKKDLDRVTTGNLPHRIGNIKFSITGIQVIIKQVMEDEQ